MHQGVVNSGSSNCIALLLKETFNIHGMITHNKPITFVSDGGSENKGEVLEWIDSFEDEVVSKKTAKTKDFIFTNNEIESTFNIFKNKFLCGKEILDKKEAVKLLAQFQKYNDNERYPDALNGCTPQEVFDGAVIDKHRFKKDIEQARKSRSINNKAEQFCKICL